MDQSQKPETLPETKPRYLWPWFVLGAFVLAIVLAVFWLSKEIERARRIRDANASSSQVPTNSPRP